MLHGHEPHCNPRTHQEFWEQYTDTKFPTAHRVKQIISRKIGIGPSRHTNTISHEAVAILRTSHLNLHGSSFSRTEM